MTLPNWQILATTACILLAVAVVLRQVIRLFASSGSKGCESGGCSSCPSKAGKVGSADFVSLESLVQSTGKIQSTGRSGD